MQTTLRFTMRLVTTVSENLKVGRREVIIPHDSVDPREFHETVTPLSPDEYHAIAQRATEMLQMFGEAVTVTYDNRPTVMAFIQHPL